ncbi:hypothetical protein BJ973_001780 [Actinoplanes tereljensis]|uniref:Uncharacterized protein n=1 Tax=Paractinoplanes tereljensis TaxID=571912 RepID=A0A919TSJ6_9ACTN|nr:CATRA conflict system CASPASE/TPR repeat-associated protein [Actinoplanes tereljensis]GIF20314.1 hypothetical protein Ate02nite_30440 [Actinoplanes tereljensis]
MSVELRDPAVLVNVLVRADRALGESDSTARQAVESLWSRARDSGLTGQVTTRWPTDLALPRDGGRAGALTVLAAAQHVDAGLVRQIMVYQQRDILGVNLLEAVQDGTREWEEFDLDWLTDWPATSIETVGAHVIHLGLVTDPAEHRLPALLRHLPAAPRRFTVWRPSPEQLVAELPAPGRERHLFAVADPAHARLQSQWFTNPPHAGLPRFTRYLEHSARMRYQSQLLAERLPDIRTATAALDRDTVVLHQALDADRPDLDRVLHAETLLATVDDGRRRVVAFLADVRAMATTVGIAVQNMTEVVGPAQVADADREIGSWTQEQLRAEEAYLDSVHLKAAEVADQASAAVGDVLRRGLDRVLLAQASVLSAVALAFTAAQTLEYKPPIPDRTYGPLVALLAAIALALPVTVVRWWRGAGPNRERSIIDVLSAVLTGASFAWFIETWLTGSRPLLAVASAIAGGALAGSVTWWRLSRLSKAATAVKAPKT